MKQSWREWSIHLIDLTSLFWVEVFCVLWRQDMRIKWLFSASIFISGFSDACSCFCHRNRFKILISNKRCHAGVMTYKQFTEGVFFANFGLPCNQVLLSFPTSSPLWYRVLFGGATYVADACREKTTRGVWVTPLKMDTTLIHGDGKSRRGVGTAKASGWVCRVSGQRVSMFPPPLCVDISVGLSCILQQGVTTLLVCLPESKDGVPLVSPPQL